MTRRSSRNQTGPPCHRLNFFYDDDDGCAFTILVHDYRFHIIVDAQRLKSKSPKGRAIDQRYRAFLEAVREQYEKDEDPVGFERQKIVEAADAKSKTSGESQDSGVGSSDGGASDQFDNDDDDNDNDNDNDSAIDLHEAGPKHKVKDVELRSEEESDPEMALQNWLLEPFSEIFADLEPAENSDDSARQTLHDWYHGPTYFYNVEIEDDKLIPIEQESQDDLEKRMAALIPQMTLPKYLRDLHIPWHNAKDLTVVTESNEPDPYHPSRVKVGDEIYFLKLVDNTQPQPTKRELRLMKEIESRGIHKKIRVPLVLGLVGFENSKTDIMGFLMTDIADPTPLTKMLDSDVIEDKRDKWAKEIERMVKVLHDHDIVWGDAKADNFMVDQNGDLWIIDFGGSYTEGWVDPELNETQEGDDMGTEKIVNALFDPEANTFDPTVESKQAETEKDVPASSRKRSRLSDDDGGDARGGSSPTKKKRSSSSSGQ